MRKWTRSKLNSSTLIIFPFSLSFFSRPPTLHPAETAEIWRHRKWRRSPARNSNFSMETNQVNKNERGREREPRRDQERKKWKKFESCVRDSSMDATTKVLVSIDTQDTHDSILFAVVTYSYRKTTNKWEKKKFFLSFGLGLFAFPRRKGNKLMRA